MTTVPDREKILLAIRQLLRHFPHYSTGTQKELEEGYLETIGQFNPAIVFKMVARIMAGNTLSKIHPGKLPTTAECTRECFLIMDEEAKQQSVQRGGTRIIQDMTGKGRDRLYIPDKHPFWPEAAAHYTAIMGHGPPKDDKQGWYFPLDADRPDYEPFRQLAKTGGRGDSSHFDRSFGEAGERRRRGLMAELMQRAARGGLLPEPPYTIDELEQFLAEPAKPWVVGKTHPPLDRTWTKFGRLLSVPELHKQDRFPPGSRMNAREALEIQLADQRPEGPLTTAEIRQRWPRMFKEVPDPAREEA